MLVFRSGLLAALLFFSVEGFAQKEFVAPQPEESAATTTTEIPEGFVARGTTHRLLVPAKHPLLGRMAQSRLLRSLEDYGSFVQVVVDLPRPGDLEALLAGGAQLADELTLVSFNGYLLDGAEREATQGVLAAIPSELRAPAPAGDERSLEIVQFNGPIKDAWLDSLRATGAFVVSYVPNNAYVVVVNGRSRGALEQLRQKPYVLGISSYHPAFKLRPALRGPGLAYTGIYDVVVQVIADEAGEAYADGLEARALAVLAPRERVLDYINLTVKLDGANVQENARSSHVFAVEPKLEARLFDEAQGQIMAAQLNVAGTQPSGPGYLAWLASLGFPGSGANPFAFSVDVHDDGVDRGSTSDVNTEFKVDGLAAGASRVTFNNNYSGDALADGRAGHGNINASIIGGYNSSTGTAFEDASGYQYGLGIAPWVGIGNSKVFSNAGAGVFNQPTATRMANAYNAGARISSNSWGYTVGNAYNADTQSHDASVRDAVSGTAGNQELAIVFAAGNSGSGAGSVHPPGTGKNVLTVGASENFRMTGSDGCGIGNTGADNVMDIISFSGRGPTSDSRKKPEIVAPGTHIEGAASRATGYDGTGVCNQFWPTGQTLYAWSSGTSHSTPAVAGFCALIRQFYLNNALAAPSPAMLKAEIVSGARHMTGVGANDTLWSNSQGFGITNMARTFDGASRIRVDQTQTLGATGATYTATGSVVNTGLPFRVVLAWTDVPGPTTGNAFVNNLDLEVTLNGTLYLGNVFTGANSSTGGALDTRNNTESVFLPAGTSGAFSIVVRGTNIAGDGVPGNADTTDQDFALLVYNGSESAPTPDFSLAATPASQTITAGNATSYTVSNTALNGFTGSVTLSATPAISGVGYSFSPNPEVAGGSSTLSVTSTTAATPGTHIVTITGTSGALVHTTNVTLVINAPPTPTFTMSVTPASQTITAGGPTSYTASTTALNGFVGDVSLSASPAISGVTYGFSPNPVAAGSSSTLSVTTTAAATPGTHTLTVTGISGAITRTSNVTLVINAPGGGNPVKTFSAAPALAIPDNNATGVSNTISVPDSLTVTSISVSTVIPHTFKGDLVVTLTGPDNTSAILHNRTGGGTDNVTTTFSIATTSSQSLTVFNGKNTAGAWTLKVQDLAAIDVGTLSSWKLTFNGEKALTANLVIPDNNTTGVTSTQTYAQTGTVAAVKVRVSVTHTFKGNLEIALIGPDNTTVLLHNRTGGSTNNVNTEYPDLTASNQSLGAFTGKAINGAWKLRVRDLAALDTGTFVSWTLSFQAQ